MVVKVEREVDHRNWDAFMEEEGLPMGVDA